MQGNCGDIAPSFTPPTGHAPLRDMMPGQCLLLADSPFIQLPQSQLWLDGLHVRLTSPRGADFTSLVWTGSNAELWMTGVTLQGNGDGVRDCWHCGFSGSGMLHAEGSFLL